ncbi:putative succinyl-CoA transferase [Lentzea sp. NBRC 105346]|nr:putative succinyl-CoA transferase [Lentzea sp. NBRC 105346]
MLRTPRLELRPDDDAGLYELVEVARGGVHPPDEMPFGTPWTDAPPEQLGMNTMQFFWARRAELSPRDWFVNFLIRVDGRVIGMQELAATDFASLREVRSGSWLGKRYQKNGYGTEMRAAILLFAFDHLGAEIARSAAWEKNVASNRVSERLGYVPDGSFRVAPRGEPLTHTRLRLDKAAFRRPSWQLEVDGLADCVHLLTG